MLQLYYIGGYNGSSAVSSVYVYDEAAKQWQSAPPLPQALSPSSCTVLNCQGLVCGGLTASNVFSVRPLSVKSSLQVLSKQCYLFDGHAWTAKFPLRTYRTGPGIVTYRGVLDRCSSTHY